VKSLTIIQETRPGLLAEITTLLERQGIDVRSMDGYTVGSVAAISLTAKPYRACLRLLAEAGFKVFMSEQLLIRIKDQPGALADISRTLANEQVDIRSIHFVNKQADCCIVALETENDFRARQVLHKLLV